MADATKSIFNKKATEKLHSPDDLEKFVQITNPSVWVVFFACVALLVGLLAWGLFGTVETRVTTTGVVIPFEENGETAPTAMCFLSTEDAEKVTAGDKAVVNGEQMTVASIQEIPMSAGEAKELLDGDYLARAVIDGDWVYATTFDGDITQLAQYVPIPVDITTNRIAPISLILRSGE